MAFKTEPLGLMRASTDYPNSREPSLSTLLYRLVTLFHFACGRNSYNSTILVVILRQLCISNILTKGKIFGQTDSEYNATEASLNIEISTA